MAKNQEKESTEFIYGFVEPTADEITEKKIRQGLFLTERAYTMARSVMVSLSRQAGNANTLDEMPAYWNSAADIIYTIKKFELNDLSNVREKIGKLIAVIDVVHLAHNCAYQICYADNKQEIREKYVAYAREVLELAQKYSHISDAVEHKQNDTKTKH